MNVALLNEKSHGLTLLDVKGGEYQVRAARMLETREAFRLLALLSVGDYERWLE